MINAGIDPIHFGVVMVANLSIGLATPPMGLVLFVAAGVSGVPFQKDFESDHPIPDWQKLG